MMPALYKNQINYDKKKVHVQRYAESQRKFQKNLYVIFFVKHRQPS